MKKLIALLFTGLLLSVSGCGQQAAETLASVPSIGTSPAVSESPIVSVQPSPSASPEADETAAPTNPAPNETIGAAPSPSANASIPSATVPAAATPIPAVAVSGNTIDLATQSGTVEISTAGTYTLTGTLADGQILVTAAKGESVTLILSDASVTNKTGAAIYATKCDLTITLASGTNNSVTDGGTAFVYAKIADEEPNAAIFAKNNLTFNGGGALTVNAGFNNGIGAKDNLTIESGTIVVNAANHGIRGNDAVTILNGNITVTAGNDGIQTNNEEDAALGSITVKGGTFKIKAAHDGIQSANTLTITSGKFDIATGGAVVADTSDSYKGIKAIGNIDITAGTFTINSADDSIHSNADVTINGGSFTLASGDDGVHADGDLTVSGGDINVTKSYEGLEGSNVNITAGTITVVSTDDGINAAGGTDASVGVGRFGNDRFTEAGSHSITISGGVITLYTTSDGIDSNGTLEVTDGTVAVFIGATRDGDATDTDRGGTIQPALYGSANIKAGAKFAVGDLWSITLAKDVTKFCLIIPGVENGQSYQVTADGSAVATITATTTVQGMMMGGGNAGGAGGRPNGGGQPSGERPVGSRG